MVLSPVGKVGEEGRPKMRRGFQGINKRRRRGHGAAHEHESHGGARNQAWASSTALAILSYITTIPGSAATHLAFLSNATRKLQSASSSTSAPPASRRST